ncbi:MAG: helix-turn-helix transcriptional regulator [Cryomorphaceae bacterium]|nr:helix-turn-helix transcriptional regulator [Cryomorphaceae bacterium]
MILILSPRGGLLARFKNALEEHRLDVAVSASAELWLESRDAALPHLLLLDVCGTTDAGRSMIQNLGLSKKSNSLWFIAITSADSAEQRIVSYRNGAIDCISEDLGVEEFVAKMERVLEACPRSKNAPQYEMTDRELILQSINSRIKQKIKVEALAQSLNMSRSSLQRTCLRHFKIGPKELIARLKMKQAKRLFDLGASNVGSVALELGFENVNNFIYTFKRLTNQTPKEYVGGVSFKPFSL